MQNCIFGSLGNLVVLPEYRKHGLGKYMISSLTSKVLERDSVAFIHVAQDNALSIKIHKEMGFKFCGVFAYKVLIPDS
ncbi:hypothetical protein FSP39_018415 [Pinctada imbricata]|uniref:N-acetyltransferase domain-containing protein n=1 Tax=Pinctada imbricata TaxID=66713 RepID=A0AA89C5M6_PINIB|nr:hypothetical protein FSP39_018415 [Pinctada imbricata]